MNPVPATIIGSHIRALGDRLTLPPSRITSCEPCLVRDRSTAYDGGVRTTAASGRLTAPLKGRLHMGYVAKQLARDERIVYMTSVHPIIFLGPTLLALLGFTFFGIEDGSASAFLIIFIAGSWGVAAWLRYVSSEFAVTDRRVIIKVGLISRKTVETLLTKVEGVQVDQGLVGRLLDFGTIRVTGTGGTKEPFKHIREPLKFRQMVQDGASSSHAQAAQKHLDAIRGPATPASSDVVGQLERLAALRDKGVLSPEEFAAQKAKLLNL